jgi:hypothetical protein
LVGSQSVGLGAYNYWANNSYTQDDGEGVGAGGEAAEDVLDADSVVFQDAPLATEGAPALSTLRPFIRAGRRLGGVPGRAASHGRCASSLRPPPLHPGIRVQQERSRVDS